MKLIALSGNKGSGKSAKVNDADYKKLSELKWNFDGKYAVRPNGVYMHRVVMGLPRKKENNLEVDHINGDQLDNRKKNLRVCNHQQNRANSKLQANNTSGFKGVHLSNETYRKKKWVVEFKLNGQKIYLGRYLTKEEAAKAYNKAAIKFYGEFARLNYV